MPATGQYFAQLSSKDENERAALAARDAELAFSKGDVGKELLEEASFRYGCAVPLSLPAVQHRLCSTATLIPLARAAGVSCGRQTELDMQRRNVDPDYHARREEEERKNLAFIQESTCCLMTRC